MKIFSSINWFKVGYAFLLILMTLLALQYTLQVYVGGHDWKTGDWLINYSDGMIRRGLVGHISLLISQYFLFNIKWTVYFFQICVFFGFLSYFLREFWKFRDSPYLIWLLLSPGLALMFWVYDPSAVFRKEIIVYFGLVLILEAFKSAFVFRYYAFSLLIFVLACMSHEISVLFLPFFVFPVFDCFQKKEGGYKNIFIFSLPFVLVAVTSFFLSVVYKGSAQSVQVICESLGNYNLSHDICGGAIEWLRYDAGHAISYVQSLGFRYYINYLGLAFLTFLPLFFMNFDKNIKILMIVGILVFLPLFFVAVDYGRFISMMYSSVIIILVWMRPDVIRSLRFCGWVLSGLYCFSWAMPNCCQYQPKKGILEMIFVGIFKLF